MTTIVLLVTLALGILCPLLVANAQEPAKIVRIGILCGESCDTSPYKAFRQRLRELDYLEGQNTAIEERAAEGKVERLSALAAELLGLSVDIMLTAGGTEAALAAKGATSTLPVVFVIAADPVGVGLVASFARPGGNATGFTILDSELEGKRLQLLKDAVPTLSRIAVLWNPDNPGTKFFLQAIQAAAKASGATLEPVVEVRREADLEPAFATIGAARSDALIVLADRSLLARRTQLVAFAAARQLPAMYPYREYVEAGG
jgi:putative tryptophan/tyrosine transport system substrate-binding protein